MVRLAQDFNVSAIRWSMGQGNFGNIDGDNRCGFGRYTEARLTAVAEAHARWPG